MNTQTNKPAAHGALSPAREQELIQEIAACVQRLDMAGAQPGYAVLLSVTNKPSLLAPAQFSLGIIEQRRGSPQAAIELYSLALATDKRNPPLTLQLGLVHLRERKWTRRNAAVARQ